VADWAVHSVRGFEQDARPVRGTSFSHYTPIAMPARPFVASEKLVECECAQGFTAVPGVLVGSNRKCGKEVVLDPLF
jgi:hypothetical protein